MVRGAFAHEDFCGHKVRAGRDVSLPRFGSSRERACCYLFVAPASICRVALGQVTCSG